MLTRKTATSGITRADSGRLAGSCRCCGPDCAICGYCCNGSPCKVHINLHLIERLRACDDFPGCLPRDLNYPPHGAPVRNLNPVNAGWDLDQVTACFWAKTFDYQIGSFPDGTPIVLRIEYRHDVLVRNLQVFAVVGGNSPIAGQRVGTLFIGGDCPATAFYTDCTRTFRVDNLLDAGNDPIPLPDPCPQLYFRGTCEHANFTYGLAAAPDEVSSCFSNMWAHRGNADIEPRDVVTIAQPCNTLPPFCPSECFSCSDTRIMVISGTGTILDGAHSLQRSVANSCAWERFESQPGAELFWKLDCGGQGVWTAIASLAGPPDGCIIFARRTSNTTCPPNGQYEVFSSNCGGVVSIL